MRPCRVIAKPAAVSKEVLDSMAYTLGTMMENEQSCTNGVAVLFNMDGFNMSNFATDYWFRLMSLLQGKIVPLRVSSLYIVNPPLWFGNIWNLTKPMITLEFQAKVRIVANEKELAYYLETGFEEFLPDEMATGQTSTNELVEDYITYRKSVEGSMMHRSSSSCNVVRRSSLSSMNAAAVATFESFVPSKNPVARRRNSISSPSTFDADSSEPAPWAQQQRRRNSITATTATTTTATATKPIMQRRQNGATSFCSSPHTMNRQSVSAQGNFDSLNSKRRDGIIAMTVYDSSPISSKKPSIQSRRSSLSSQGSSCSSLISNKPLMQRRRGSLSSQGSCSSPVSRTSQRNLLSAHRGIPDSPNDSPNKRWSEISAVCDSPSMKKRSSIFSTVPLCGDSPPGTTRQEQARQQHNRLERQSSFSSSFLDVPSLDMITRGNSRRSVVMKSTESKNMHRSTTTIIRGASVRSMRSGSSDRLELGTAEQF
jgi:CRAL/TRIO domain